MTNNEQDAALLLKSVMELSAKLNNFILQNVDLEVYRDAMIMLALEGEELKAFVSKRAKESLSNLVDEALSVRS